MCRKQARQAKLNTIPLRPRHHQEPRPESRGCAGGGRAQDQGRQRLLGAPQFRTEKGPRGHRASSERRGLGAWGDGQLPSAEEGGLRRYVQCKIGGRADPTGLSAAEPGRLGTSPLVPCWQELAKRPTESRGVARPRLGRAADIVSVSLGTRRQTHGTGLALTGSALSESAHLYSNKQQSGGGTATLICLAAVSKPFLCSSCGRRASRPGQ